MRVRSIWRSKSLVFATVTVALAGVGIGASAASAASPTLTVSPNQGLADTQNVTVTGSALGPNASAFTVEWTTGSVDLSTCDFSTLAPAFADGSGAISLQRTVRRLIAVNGTIDCAGPGACVIGVSTDFNTIVASAAIAFDPKIPPVLPKVKVVPAIKLRDHQLVAVSGSGFTADSSIDVEECLAADTLQCAFETDRFVTTTAAGAFSTKSFAVEREFQTFDQSGPHTVDCAASPTTCVLSVGGDLGSGVPTTAALQFDKSVPRVVARLRTSPSTGLTDLQNVTVTGSGFLPGATVSVEQCAGQSDLCGFIGVNVTAGFTGGFTTTYSARRLVSEFDFSGLHVADCASKLVTCRIVASNNSGGSAIVGSAITFRATRPAISATVSALPTRGLHDNERLAVALRGFSAYQPVTLIECAASALTAQDSSLCDPNTQLTTTTPAIGNVPSMAFFAKRTLAIANALVDCGAKPGACILLASTNGSIGIGPGPFVSTVTNGVSASSKHPSIRAAASLPTSLSPQTLHSAARSTTPGVASIALSFTH